LTGYSGRHNLCTTNTPRSLAGKATDALGLFKEIDILINNAGMSVRATVKDTLVSTSFTPYMQELT